MKKKNKFNHVGRPTNEEIKRCKKNKKIKIILIIMFLLSISGIIFIYINKDQIELRNVMGNSSIKTAYFRPDKMDGKNLNLYYYSNNPYFVSTLYKLAGFSSDYYKIGYKQYGIQIYSSQRQLLATYLDGTTFAINKRYGGENLILRIYMKNKNTNNIVYKYLFLYIDKNHMYNLRTNEMLNYADNILVGKKFSDLKKIFSTYETAEYDGDWCSWFVWNLYYKYGLVAKNTWLNSYGDINHDPDLRYALGWTAYGGYNGNIRNSKKGNLSYIPKPGDLIIYKWAGSDASVDHVGMVKSVTNNSIETIEGNGGGWGISYFYYKTSKVNKRVRKIDRNKYIGNVYDENGKLLGEILGYYTPKIYF